MVLEVWGSISGPFKLKAWFQVSKFAIPVLVVFIGEHVFRLCKVRQLRWPSGESVRLESCRLGFDSESGQTDDFKVGIHSFPAWRLPLKGQCGGQAGKLTCCAVGKVI